MSARRVVVTDYTFPDLAHEAEAARRAGADFAAHQCRTAEEVEAAVAGADVALVQFAPLTAKAIAGMSGRGGIVRYGIGYDNIDLAAASERGLPVGYVPDYCTEEVADHTAALLLARLRKLAELDASVRTGEWNAVAVARPIKPFRETTIGFFGLGRIGALVLARLKPFGFRFLVADPQVDSGKADALGAEAVDPVRLFTEADVVSLHAPATPATTHIVDAARLRSMKPHAVIVNTARGKLIDEAALAEALAQGTIGGAALDVFEVEPLPGDSALRQAPHATLTPHAAWYSDAAITSLQKLVAADVESLLAGRPPRCPVPGSIR